MVSLGNDWEQMIGDEFTKPYYLKLREFLKEEYRTKKIFPNMFDIFNALKLTPYEDVRVVILGQDPYIGEGEAHGLSFSVKPGIRIPPSLRNIYKEAIDDVGITMPTHGFLEGWAKQGVLMLNTVLTVRAGQSKSHANKGWEEFTASVIRKLSEREKPIVFLLWGADAQRKREFLTNPNHLVLCAAHPSPLAGGRYFGSKPFSKTNAFLRSHGLGEINWQV